MRRLVILAAVLALVLAACGKDDTTKPAPTGACCAPAGTCTVTTKANCTGTWTEAGGCTPNPCAGTEPPEFVLIPAGTFTMGSPSEEPGRQAIETRHQVTLTKAFYVSNSEVTQAEWQLVMGWNESDFQGDSKPVENVTWFDCISYCNRRSGAESLDSVYVMIGRHQAGVHIADADSVACNWTANGYRLLTEAEWEYACRATSTTAFCNGAITNIECSALDPGLDLIGWYCGNRPQTGTADVRMKAANAWGLYDMHGNVAEWCWDRSGAYGGTVTDPVGPASGSGRVIRGGSAWDWAVICRSACRITFIGPGYRLWNIGLRLARTAQ